MPNEIRRCEYRFESFCLDVAERRLTRADEPIVLPARAFDVLALLVQQAGSLVTKDDLLQHIWAGRTVEEANLAVAISTLRRALGRELIQTVPKHGYRFVAKVDSNQKLDANHTSEPTIRKGRERLVRILTGWTVLLATIGAFAFQIVPAVSRPRSQFHPLSPRNPIALVQLTHNRIPDSQASGGPDGRVVFTSNRDGNPEVYLADADGRTVRRLTKHPGRDEFPRWSPDGRLIAFASDRGGRGVQIYVMSPDGASVRPVTQLALGCSEPSWSPDGRRIAFRRDSPPDDGAQDIYTIDLNGTDLRRLTTAPSNEVSPAWSPDGRTIAFSSNRDGLREFDLFQIDSNGGEVRRLSSSPGDDGAPAWSPDGSELAFVSNRAGGPNELYVMQLNGGGTRRIARGGAEYPSWSRDGTSLVYSSNTPGNLELFRVELDSAHALADNEAEAIVPTWSPDGRALIFTSNRDGKRALFRIDESGGAIRKLTDGSANDWFPSWAPDGRRVAFQSDRAGAGHLDLCILEIDSRATRCITSGGGAKANPAWSPDGTRIAFQSNRDGGPRDFRIYTIRPDGTGLIRLTSGPGYDGDPAWSPDGSRLAFTSDRIDRRFAIFTMKNDGTDVALLARTEHNNTNPWWSPDGRWIVYTDWRQTGNDLFVVPSEGGAPIRLTYGNASWTRWNPRGDSLVFTSNRRGRLELFLMGLPEGYGS